MGGGFLTILRAWRGLFQKCLVLERMKIGGRIKGLSRRDAVSPQEQEYALSGEDHFRT